MPRHQIPQRDNRIVTVSLGVGGFMLVVLALFGVLSRIAGSPAAQQATSTPVLTDILPKPVDYDDLIPPPDLNPFANYQTAAVWISPAITYSIANCPRSLDCELAHQAVREAVAAWDAVADITLEEVAADGDIVISWVTGEHGDRNPFDGKGGCVAHAAFPYRGGNWWLDGDVHLDDDETWVVHTPTQPFPAEIHLPTVLLHELGHALGVDHSESPDALMWETYTGVRQLTADDIAAIQSLYGPASRNAEPLSPEPLASPAPVTARPQATLNFRAGPGTDYAVIGRVPFEATVPVVGRNADSSWLHVEYDGAQGWVAGWLCSVTGSLDNVPIIE